MEIEKGKVHAPEIGQTWVNSPPFSLSDLRGRVVLVDFWDYTCANCIRTLPYVVEWHRRYFDKGLTVIGVHAPEFSFARTKDFVAAAIARFGIEYPVVMDNGYMVWQAFANKCWPAKYLIDKDGYIRFFHFGEGDYEATEQAIQTLLREINAALELGPPMAPLRDTDRPGAACYRTTPELYLGYQRGRIGNEGGFQHRPAEKTTPSTHVALSQADGVWTEVASKAECAGHYVLPEKLQADIFYLSGPWVCGPESIRAATNGAGEPASLLVFYTAKEVNLVMAPDGDAADTAAGASPPQPAPRTIEVLQDGLPLEREDAGEDVRYAASGASVIEIATPRMYNLVRNARIGQHLLQLVAHEPGLECFAFTFVTCATASES